MPSKVGDLSLTVIVVTLNRPTCVHRCLTCLSAQTTRAQQIIVVDASGDDLTRKVVAEFGEMLYLRNESGWGRMTVSRNIGLRSATGDIIAFVDDDAFPEPQWAEKLLETYGTDGRVGAVGGRVLNNGSAEDAPASEIGRLKPNGVLSGRFAADPGTIVEVDHVMGCNMSFRRSVIAELGGFRTDYGGISGVLEDSDMCLRVRRQGYHILFNPEACVNHIGAPQAKGKRFDNTYAFYMMRNHNLMLVRNYGPFAAIVWRFVLHSIREVGLKWFLKPVLYATSALASGVGGTCAGLFVGTSRLARLGRDPIRHDAEAEAIRTALSTQARSHPSGPTEVSPTRLPNLSVAGSQ